MVEEKFISDPKLIQNEPAKVARFIFPLLLVAIALLLATTTVRAHGGGYYQVRGMPIGAYILHVWTSPGLLRTGQIHVDTAVFDAAGLPALATLVQITVKAMDGSKPPMTAMAGAPMDTYPYMRETTFPLASPGDYRINFALSDTAGFVGMAAINVHVQTITWSLKLAIVVLGLLSAACGVWLLLHTKAIWRQHMPKISEPSARAMSAFTSNSQLQARCTLENHSMQEHRMERSTGRSLGKSKARIRKGGFYSMRANLSLAAEWETGGWLARLNSLYHARALWIFMLIIVAHWLEHVLQIYQIYGLGWSPAIAGGLLGLFFPRLIESEILHFVYDFIQWAGIVLLRPGFGGRARTFWTFAMIIQSWHYVEHVLLMGQYLTGYYLFGAAKQISIGELLIPRAELHFFYNLLVFVPLVIAVHYYLRPTLAQALDAEAQA